MNLSDFNHRSVTMEADNSEALVRKASELSKAANAGIERFLEEVSKVHKPTRIDSVWRGDETEYLFYEGEKLVATLNKTLTFDKETGEMNTEFLGDIRNYG